MRNASGHQDATERQWKKKVNKNMYISSIRVMLHGTIRNDDF